jgi:hypothetical protein
MLIDFTLFATLDTSAVEYTMAKKIFDALLPMAFLFSATGLALTLWKNQENIAGMVEGVAIAAICVFLLAKFPDFVQKGQETFSQYGEKIQSDIGDFQTVWNEEIPEQKGGGFSIEAFKNLVGWFLFKVLQALGKISRMLVDWIQPLFLVTFIGMAPITVCMFQIPALRSVAISTWLQTFGVMLWPIGTAFADIIVAKVGLGVLGAIGITSFGSLVTAGTAGSVTASATVGAGGGAAGLSAATAVLNFAWPKIVTAMVLLVIFINACYLATPIIISAILRGASPAGAALGSAAFMSFSMMPLANQMGKLTQALKGLLGKLGDSPAPTPTGGDGGGSSSPDNFGSSSSLKGLPASGSNEDGIRPSRVPRGGGGGTPKIGRGGDSLGMGGSDLDLSDPNNYDVIQTGGGLNVIQPKKLGSPAYWAERRNNVLSGIKGIEDADLN